MPDRLQIDTVKAGDEAEVLSHKLTRTDLVMYAGASGDFNPMHTDEVSAQAAGLPSVFGHGMFSMGLLGTALTNYVGVGNLKSYKVRFTKQTWPDEELTTAHRGHGHARGGRREVGRSRVLAGQRRRRGEGRGRRRRHRRLSRPWASASSPTASASASAQVASSSMAPGAKAEAAPGRMSIPRATRRSRRSPSRRAEDVDAAVTAARRAFDESGWATMRAKDRKRIVQRVAHGDRGSSATSSNQLQSLDNGMPDRFRLDLPVSSRDRRRHLRLPRRLDRPDLRRDAAAPTRAATSSRTPCGAGRRGGRGHPVERAAHARSPRRWRRRWPRAARSC